MAGQIYPCPVYGSNWIHQIADFVFCLISILFLILEIYNVFRVIGKPYVKSLDSWSDLPYRCVDSIVS